MTKRAKMNKQAFDAESVLKRPYGRVLTPEEDGTYRAEIPEFPGCIATGDTQLEALASLEDVAVSWLEATHNAGKPIPEPTEVIDFSGRLVLRLPKSLHRRASIAAEREGVSLNTFIVSSVAEHLGGRATALASQPMAQVIVLAAPSMTSSYQWQRMTNPKDGSLRIFIGRTVDAPFLVRANGQQYASR